MSCQYPLTSVYDITRFNEMNVEENTWNFLKTEETECEVCQNVQLENGTLIARVYEAELSARINEVIRFHIRFSKGSHMNFTWTFEEDLGVNYYHTREVFIIVLKL